MFSVALGTSEDSFEVEDGKDTTTLMGRKPPELPVNGLKVQTTKKMLSHCKRTEPLVQFDPDRDHLFSSDQISAVWFVSHL